MENKINNIQDIKTDSKLSLESKPDLETSKNEQSFFIKFKNFFKFNKAKDTNVSIEEASYKISDSIEKSKLKVFWRFIRIPLVSIGTLGAICGIVYPIVITGIGQAIFWYQANGSQIRVQDSNGNWITYGSEKIGQDFFTNNNGNYFFGRADFATSSDSTTKQQSVKDKLTNLIKENKLESTYQDSNEIISFPEDLITTSGSGVDPSISIEAAKWQIPLILAVRNKDKTTDLLTEEQLLSYINEYSSHEFVGIYGNTTTNIVLLNLRLDGIINK